MSENDGRNRNYRVICKCNDSPIKDHQYKMDIFSEANDKNINEKKPLMAFDYRLENACNSQDKIQDLFYIITPCDKDTKFFCFDIEKIEANDEKK